MKNELNHEVFLDRGHLEEHQDMQGALTWNQYADKYELQLVLRDQSCRREASKKPFSIALEPSNLREDP